MSLFVAYAHAASSAPASSHWQRLCTHLLEMIAGWKTPSHIDIRRRRRSSSGRRCSDRSLPGLNSTVGSLTIGGGIVMSRPARSPVKLERIASYGFDSTQSNRATPTASPPTLQAPTRTPPFSSESSHQRKLPSVAAENGWLGTSSTLYRPRHPFADDQSFRCPDGALFELR
jgi:hypothetical protein